MHREVEQPREGLIQRQGYLSLGEIWNNPVLEPFHLCFAQSNSAKCGPSRACSPGAVARLQSAQRAKEGASLKQVQVIDSHTGGEPTRTVIGGGPVLGDGDLQARRHLFQRDHEAFRRALVTEPRSSDAMVGALLCEPSDAACVTGVIFFNNSGCLGMCGHGTIGVVATLAYLGRIKPGHHRIETPVGIVGATLNEDGTVTIENVPSYRWAAAVDVEVPGYGKVTGDVAYGGNWFFLVKHHPYAIERKNLEQLIGFTWAIRQALTANRIRGAEGAEIDHIELHSPSLIPGR